MLRQYKCTCCNCKTYEIRIQINFTTNVSTIHRLSCYDIFFYLFSIAFLLPLFIYALFVC